MAYTPSQKLRLRLMYLYQNSDTKHKNFDDFYEAFIDMLLEDPAFIARTFGLIK